MSIDSDKDRPRRRVMSGRERTRRFRERKAARLAEEERQAKKAALAATGAWRIHAGLILPGELAPKVDAMTIPEAARVARLFAKLLGLPERIEGESLSDLERRVYDAWVLEGGPLICLATGKFDELGISERIPDMPPIDWAQEWTFLAGADDPLPPEPEEPKGLPPMTFAEEKALLLRKEFEAEQKQLKALEQIQNTIPVGFFQSEII